MLSTSDLFPAIQSLLKHYAAGVEPAAAAGAAGACLVAFSVLLVCRPLFRYWRAMTLVGGAAALGAAGLIWSHHPLVADMSRGWMRIAGLSAAACAGLMFAGCVFRLLKSGAVLCLWGFVLLTLGAGICGNQSPISFADQQGRRLAQMVERNNLSAELTRAGRGLSLLLERDKGAQ